MQYFGPYIICSVKHELVWLLGNMLNERGAQADEHGSSMAASNSTLASNGEPNECGAQADEHGSGIAASKMELVQHRVKPDERSDA